MFINGHYPVYQGIVHVESNKVIAYNANITNQKKHYQKRLLELYQVWLSVENAPGEIVIIPISFRSLVDMLVSGKLEQLMAINMNSKTICFEVYDMEELFVNRHIDQLIQVRALGFHLSLKDVTNSLETGQIIALIQPEILKLSKSVITNRDSAFINRIMDLNMKKNTKVIATGIDTCNDFIYLKQTKCTIAQGVFLETTSSAIYKAIG